MPHLRGFYPARGRFARGFLILLALLLLPAACVAVNKSEEEIKKELQTLKAEIVALKEKVAEMQTSQQETLALLKKTEEALARMEKGQDEAREAAKEAAKQTVPSVVQPPAPPAPPPPLTISQLFKERAKWLGTRVTVRGPVGPVLMHQKILYLKGPEGMVEVFFGSLDDKTVKQLTSQPVEQPLTITGMLSPEAKPGAKLRIIAEAVEY